MSVLDRIRSWIRDRSSATESGSSTNGFLSYSAEWHALAVGAGLGLLLGLTLSPELSVVVVAIVTGKAAKANNHLRDAGKEVAYTFGGLVPMFVVGFFARGVTTVV